MKNSMHMEIAGIDFSVSSGLPLNLGNLPDTYLQFLRGTGSSTGDIPVNVRIETGTMPDTAKMTKVFDTDQSWSMFRHGDDYFLSHNFPTANDRVIWLAAFDIHCNDITIYCSDLLVHKEKGLTTFSTPLTYPLDQLLLMHILAVKGGALLHAAGLGMDSRGCVFPGRSGAGKSTLSRLFLGKQNVEMLSDDRVVIRKMDGGFRAFGTPWAGDAGIAENRSVALDRIFFIHHADTNMIKELPPKDAVKRLMPVTSIPWYDERAVQKMLAFCEGLVLSVPAYELHFRPDSAVVTFLEDLIAQGKI